MFTLPRIEKERVIVDYCGSLMVHSAREFLAKSPFIICFKEWSILKGICEGSSSPSYCVRILFDAKGIANSSCTCVTNRSVPCKHIAGLLLLWYEKHDEIPDRTEWARRLRQSNRDELVELLEKMVDLYPENMLDFESDVIQT